MRSCLDPRTGEGVVNGASERWPRSGTAPSPVTLRSRERVGGSRPLRHHLVVLVLGILVPVVVLQGFMLWRFAAQERTTYTARLLQSANEIAADIDRDIDGLLITLRTLALSRPLQSGDLREFHLLSRQVTQGADMTVIVVDKDMSQLSNTLVDFGAPMPTVAGEAVARQVFETGRPAVSDLLFGRVSRRLVLDVAYPVTIDEQVRYVLLIAMPPHRFLQTLQTQKIPPDWTSGLTDRTGRVIARSHKHDQFVGTSLPSDLLDRQTATAPFPTRNLEGEPVLRAVAKSRRTEWVAAVTVPLTVVNRATRQALMLSVLVNAAILGLAVTLAVSFGRKLVSSLNSAAGFAARVETTPGILPPTDVAEVATVVDALSESRLRLKLALDSGIIGIYSWNSADGGHQWDENVRRHFGFRDSKPTMKMFLANIHPDDRPRVQSALDAALAPGGDGVFLAEYRFRGIDDGVERWIAATGKVFGLGDQRRMVGTVRDVTARKLLELQQQLLTHELAHRVKNSFAVLQSIMRSTLRSTPDPKEFAEAFTRRMSSIAAAHDILTANQWSNADLEALIRAQISGHMGDGHVDISGPPIVVPAEMGVPISLVVHELASNAAKHGAMSTPTGRVALSWSVRPTDSGSRVVIDWRERGGPPVIPPKARGFGTTLIERALAGSRVTPSYEPEGFACTIEIDLESGATAQKAEFKSLAR